MDWIELYNDIHNKLNNITPLYFDCGQLCNNACCSSSNNSGMVLFPYEDEYYKSISHTFSITDGNFYKLLVCDGTCDRDIRPLSCIIYPLFPYLYEDDRLDLKLDTRAYNKCPLYFTDIEQLKLQPLFRLKLFKIFEQLIKNDEINLFLKKLTKELVSIENLIK